MHPIVPGRECGKCSLCCKVLFVAEVQKPANVWCKHCDVGHGCSIYPTRPNICREFACGWLMSPNVGDEWYPLRSHMVLSLAPLDGILTCTVSVDGNHPWRWLEEPYRQQLKQMATKGLHVRSPEEILLVHVRANGRVWLVLPDKDIEITRCSYVVKLIANGEWGVEIFDTQDEAQARVGELVHS